MNVHGRRGRGVSLSSFFQYSLNSLFFVLNSGDKELRVGYANSMTVKLTVENLEEDTAYDAKVILTYSSFLGYVGVRSDEVWLPPSH